MYPLTSSKRIRCSVFQIGRGSGICMRANWRRLVRHKKTLPVRKKRNSVGHNNCHHPPRCRRRSRRRWSRIHMQSDASIRWAPSLSDPRPGTSTCLLFPTPPSLYVNASGHNISLIHISYKYWKRDMALLEGQFELFTRRFRRYFYVNGPIYAAGCFLSAPKTSGTHQVSRISDVRK